MAVIKKKKIEEQESEGSLLKQVLWLLAAGMALMLMASLVSFDPGDMGHYQAPLNEQPANWCGRFGAVVSYHIYRTLGPGAWVLVGGIVALLWRTAFGYKTTQLPLRACGMVMMALSASGFIILTTSFADAPPEGAGGLLAIWTVDELLTRFNPLGTFFVFCMILGVGALVTADRLVLALPRAMLAIWKKASTINFPKPVLVGWPWKRWGGVTDSKPDIRQAIKLAGRKARSKGAIVDLEDQIDETAGGLGATESFDPKDHRRKSRVIEAEDEEDDSDAGQELEIDEAAEETSFRRKVDPELIMERIRNLPIKFASDKKAPQYIPPVVDLSGYRFPGIDMLVEPEHNFTEEMGQIVREQAVALQQALQLYGIEAKVESIDSGPVITLYEVQLAPGTKVATINAVDSDIARELKAQNIRVVPNTAGKSTVGVEVPNIKKEKVRLKELMQLGGEKVQKMTLPMFLGKDASGNPLIADLAAMPHMLIAGTTGSGKSVCMNSIIMSFLFTKRPDELKLVLVDPKMVEMSQFKSIPHLMCPVVTDMPKAAAILEWAVTKMDERYALLAEAAVRDVDSYNQLGDEELFERLGAATEESRARVPKKLPRMVFVIDELADLMMTNREVESFIVRIAQKARAVGIHLILATQRPSANVVTGLIKSNMPCRVSFKVNSGMDSRIVLDAKGAELLLGQGDMLFLSPRTGKLVRAQGTLVDDAEIREVVKFVKDVSSQSFEPQLMQLRVANSESTEDEAAIPTGNGLAAALQDPLFEECVRIVLESQRGSVSLLQRRLSIGYGRAARVIDLMAELGFLGDFKGNNAREVMMSWEDWVAMKSQFAPENQPDQAAGDAAASGSAAVSPAASSSAPADIRSSPMEEDEEDAEADSEPRAATPTKPTTRSSPKAISKSPDPDAEVEYVIEYEDDDPDDLGETSSDPKRKK